MSYNQAGKLCHAKGEKDRLNERMELNYDIISLAQRAFYTNTQFIRISYMILN